MRRRPTLSIVALAMAVAILGGIVVFAFWAIPDLGTFRPSPALRQFFDRCAHVRPEMTEVEIDRLFVDYASGWTEALDALPPPLARVVRPPALAKIYYSIPHPKEGQYAISVYFDKDGRVVGKQMTWSGE